MAGPWEDYAQPAEADGPWKAYQPQQTAEQPASFAERFDAAPPVPQSFLHRIAMGMAIGETGQSPAELRAKGFEDFDVASNTVSNFKGGLDRIKKGFQETHSSLDVGMGAVQSLLAPVSAAFQAIGGAGEKATGGILTGDQINTALMVADGAPGRFARVRDGAPQVIGELPMPQDFKAAGKVLGSDHAEANLERLWQEKGIHPAEAVHDAEADAFLKHDITAPHRDIVPDPETERILTESGGKPGSLSAAVTPPDYIPLDIQPPSRPGSLTASAQGAVEGLFDIGRDIQMKLTPMARGSVRSMSTVKDYRNAMVQNEWDLSRYVGHIEKNYKPDDWARMFNAMEEESLSRRLGEPDSAREHTGINTLPPDQRALVIELDTIQQLEWQRAKDKGRVHGEGVPFHAPRMAINIPKGEIESARSLDALGYDFRTRSPGMKQRKHMELEATERALKIKYGEEASIARDIRSVPIGIKQLQDVNAAADLVDAIKQVGERVGEKTVKVGGEKPEGWFTIDHPGFTESRMMFDKEGNIFKNDDGSPAFERVPLHVPGDFEGPLRAALWGKSGESYKALMQIKGKTMSYIMNSPMIHNMVELGRALPAMRTRIIKAYIDGNRVKQDPAFMHDAIAHGLVPIGKRFFNQDISAVMEAPNMTPGRSMESQVLAAVPGLFDERAGTAVKQAVDKLGNFWHNTLLWDRIADLQAGIFKITKEDLVGKGHDPNIASYIAAHYANRYAGALPKEAMSEAATKISNFVFFSRSFTFGNLGVLKDMFTGLPKDVLAQIERDAGFKAGSIEGAGKEGAIQDVVTSAKSIARRKAISVVALDVALAYVGNSIYQNASNVLLGDSNWTQEGHDYLRRMVDTMNDAKVHPLSLLNPFYIPERLSATSENEPGRHDRVLVGYAKDGTAIYSRNPVGKIGEEFTNYFSSPLDMMRKKEGTIMRPLTQLFSNDAGFGRKIYDTSANTPEGVWKNAVLIAEHLAGSQLPMGQIKAGIDLVKGEGDSKVNAMQAFGPFLGTTFSKGAPGGPAVGVMYDSKNQHEFAVQQAMPDIRKQIKRGDIDGAMDRMMELDIPVGLQRWYVKTTQDPALRMSTRAVRDFYLHSTPEQRALFDRWRDRPKPYAGPNLGPISPPPKDPSLIMNGPASALGIRG